MVIPATRNLLCALSQIVQDEGRGGSLESLTINLQPADNVCQEEPSNRQDRIGWRRHAGWDRKITDYLAGGDAGGPQALWPA